MTETQWEVVVYSPQFWQIYKDREVVGLSYLFLAMDTLGAVFSILSLGTSGTESKAPVPPVQSLPFLISIVAFKTSLDGIAFAGYRASTLSRSLVSHSILISLPTSCSDRNHLWSPDRCSRSPPQPGSKTKKASTRIGSEWDDWITSYCDESNGSERWKRREGGWEEDQSRDLTAWRGTTEWGRMRDYCGNMIHRDVKNVVLIDRIDYSNRRFRRKSPKRCRAWSLLVILSEKRGKMYQKQFRFLRLTRTTRWHISFSLTR